MSDFVVLSKEDFEAILPKNSLVIDVRNCNEYVYQLNTKNSKVDIRIYSTVDKSTNRTRPIGSDAIRIVFWDNVSDRPIGKGKRIHRVERATTIKERIQQRIDEFFDTANDLDIVDFDYVKAVLLESSWNSFALSLLESFKRYKSLTDKQLAYVLGTTNPKGKPTFEAQVLKNKPDFRETYLDCPDEEDSDDGKMVEKEKKNISNNTSKTKDEPLSQNEADRAREEMLLVSRGNDSDNIYKDVERVEMAEIVSTKKYEDHKYSFDSFNIVQSMVFPRRADDNNFVISANTSAGKTICAEMMMDSTLAQSKRVVYMSPLKSLTQEKYDDWQKRFPKENICILTGDYVLSEKRKQEISESRIIVMTSEMVDSRTRRMETEKNYWLKEVGLLVVDESHILTTERGHAVESGIMRFTKINSDAQVCFLSATMPNVDQLGSWLSSLNSKKTIVIHSDWRPVELQKEIIGHPVIQGGRGYPDYWATQEAKRSIAVDVVMSKPEEKFLVFCHDKNTGRDMVKRLQSAGEKTVTFHNADLDLNERLEVESKFSDRTNGIRVLVSTSTLAWGRNLPARNVVIVGVHRGLNEVDELDIIQMAGRAGRYGIDDAGFVFLICPEGSEHRWQQVFTNPRPVVSVLNNHNILAFHVISEIASKEIDDVNTLMKWYSRSLAAKQNYKSFSTIDAEALMKDLEKMEMIKFSGIKPFVTGLGRTCSWLYFSPYDVYAWYKNFKLLFEGRKANPNNVYSEPTPAVGVDDLTLSWAIGDIPSNDLGYVSSDLKSHADDFKWRLRNRGIHCSDAVGTVMAVYSSLSNEEENGNGLMKALKRGIVFDIERQVNAFSLIDEMYAKWEKKELWQTLAARVKYGISDEIAPLCKLSGVGAKKATKLFQAGIKSLKDVADKKNRKKLLKVFAPTTATKVQKEASELISQ